MRFTKIKVRENGVELSWTVKGSAGTDTVNHESTDKPLETFPAALNAFRGYVVELLGLPKSWLADMTVTTLSLNEETDGRRGLIVTAVRKIEKAANRPFVINTPLMKERGDNTSDAASGIFDPEIIDLIAEAEKQATSYRKGEKAQIDAFEQTSKTDPAAPGEQPTNDIEKRRRRKKDVDPKAGTPNEVVNPDKTAPPPDDATIRNILLAAGRDVPVDAIAQWIETERKQAVKWAEHQLAPALDTARGETTPEPEFLQKVATLPLLDAHAAAIDNVTVPEVFTVEGNPGETLSTAAEQAANRGEMWDSTAPVTEESLAAEGRRLATPEEIEAAKAAGWTPDESPADKWTTEPPPKAADVEPIR